MKIISMTVAILLLLNSLLTAQTPKKCIDGNCKNGVGKLLFTNGEVYTGSFLNGLRHGKGSQLYANRNLYDGYWVNGSRSIIGKYTYSDGSKKVFTGKFKNDIGTGKLTTNNSNPQTGRLLANNQFVPDPTADPRMIADLKKSVIGIEYLQSFIGTGFVLDDKYFATNIHVEKLITEDFRTKIEKGLVPPGSPMRISLRMYDKTLVNIPIRLIYRHPGGVDFAVLEIDSNFVFPYPAVELQTILPHRNTEVFAIGGATMSVKSGNVLSISHEIITAQNGFTATGQFITSLAPAIPGDSGSPLFTTKGKVVAIVCWGTPQRDITLSMTLTPPILKQLAEVVPGLRIATSPSTTQNAEELATPVPPTLPPVVNINQRIIDTAVSSVVSFPETGYNGCLLSNNCILTNSSNFPQLNNGRRDSISISVNGKASYFMSRKIIVDSLLDLCIIKFETSNTYHSAQIAAVNPNLTSANIFIVHKGNSTTINQGAATLGLIYQDVLFGMVSVASMVNTPVFNSGGRLIGMVAQVEGGISFFLDLTLMQQEIMDICNNNL